jgi:hypothetical protein
MTATRTVAGLAEALAAAFIKLTPPEQRLVAAAYRLLAYGSAVPQAALAAAAGWSVASVGARLADWPGVYLDGDGGVVGLWGLAVEAVSEHRSEVEGAGTAWAWCALDPLFIVPILGTRARVSSNSPTTGETVEFRINPTSVMELRPASAVVSLLVPQADFDDTVRQTFCHFVHYFGSTETARAWTATHEGTFTCPVDEAADVGRRLAAASFPALGVA